MSIFHKRQGQMDLYDSYFFTQTITNFRHLLDDDSLKLIIINSMQFLVKNGYVEIYGYVIMPNHLHIIWSMLRSNGKESPATSFSKYTAHAFKKSLTKDPKLLNTYLSGKKDREYQFWKRDPLAIPLSTDDILVQKLDYIHNNPVAWKNPLCSTAEDYRWSSANFYLTGVDEFDFLTDFRDELLSAGDND